MNDRFLPLLVGYTGFTTSDHSVYRHCGCGTITVSGRDWKIFSVVKPAKLLPNTN